MLGIVGMELTPSGTMIEPSAGGTTFSTRTKQSGGLKPRNRKDLMQYEPIKTFHVSDSTERLHTVANGITDETIVITTGHRSVCVYRLKVTEFKDEPAKKPQVELVKVHEVIFTTRIVGSFAVSSECSLTLPPRNLSYSITSFGSNTIYYFDFKDDAFLPEIILMDDMDLFERHGSSIMIFENEHPTIDMAIKSNTYLACHVENRLIVVWEIFSQTRLCVFQLKFPAIHIAWHPSENYKLFLVDSNGYVKFFNVMKERCYMSMFMCHSPLYCGDWANSNSLMGAVGWAGGITCFNSSSSNTNTYNIHEQSCKAFKRVRFNPMDNRSIATLEKGLLPQDTIRLWRSHTIHDLWSYSNDQIGDIAWMFGKPYLVAVGQKKIFVFDAFTNM